MANIEKGTFPSKPETNPNGGTSSGSTLDIFRMVNAIITLRLGKEIDNHVGDNLNEKSNTTPTIIVDDSRESKEDEPTVTVTVAPSKISPSPPMQGKKHVSPFPDQLKGKRDQGHIDKIKETFS